jgi:hypothetical protein
METKDEVGKSVKNVFVIMPFNIANTRDNSDLNELYDNVFKQFIESIRDLKNTYNVSRSSTEFNMHKNIIRQLNEADIVLCDLSGESIPNPNVMFELGIRFSVSRSPVILCREKNDKNKQIFDVGWLHTYEYKATQTSSLQEYIKSKLLEYELEPYNYESPVLSVLGGEFDSKKEAKKNSVLRNLESLEKGLDFLGTLYWSSIATYLNKSIGNDPTPNEIDEFKSWWVTERETISKYDWTGYTFKVNSFAPLENLFIELPLAEYLPQNIKSKVQTKLLKYYIKWFVCQNYQTNEYIDINNFLVDIFNMSSIISYIAALISEENHEKKLRIYDALNGLLDD